MKQLKIKEHFEFILQEARNNPELLLLLNQIVNGTKETLFWIIELKLYNHESMNMDMWDDPVLWSGNVLIPYNAALDALACRQFIIPVLNIKIDTGRIHEFNNQKVMRVMWRRK